MVPDDEVVVAWSVVTRAKVDMTHFRGMSLEFHWFVGHLVADQAVDKLHKHCAHSLLHLHHQCRPPGSVFSRWRTQSQEGDTGDEHVVQPGLWLRAAKKTRGTTIVRCKSKTRKCQQEQEEKQPSCSYFVPSCSYFVLDLLGVIFSSFCCVYW